MNKLKRLLDNNLRWAEKRLSDDPDYFTRMDGGQKPKYLWIGCADSRVPPNTILGLPLGEIFVHRNISNLVISSDINALSVLQYGIEILDIEHVIVCGHYGCGGIEAAMTNKPLGLVDNWIKHIRDIYEEHKKELESIADPALRRNALSELNVRRQVLNVCQTSIVQKAWQKNRTLTIHGWIYDVSNGRVKDLNCSIST